MTSVTTDSCPECGADFMDCDVDNRPLVRPDIGVPVESGELPAYLVFEDGKMYLQVTVECRNCDWSYEGRLAFEGISDA